MDLVTTWIYAPGAQGTGHHRDQIVVDPALGLLAVASCPGEGEPRRAALRLTLDLIHGHVQRHSDLLARFRHHPTPQLRQRVLELLDAAITRAAGEIFAFARRHEQIAISLDLVLLLGNEAFVCHVGDGRVYLIRRGLIHQLTVDPTQEPRGELFNAEIADQGAIHAPPGRRTALGPEPQVDTESLCMESALEDRFVVCGADLHRALPEGVLHDRLATEAVSDLQAAVLRETGPQPLAAAIAQIGSGDPFTADSAAARLALLAPIPLFAHCHARELRAIAVATRPRRLPAQAVIFEQGAAGDELFLVISGGVEILRDGSPIATLGPGSNFGEMALLDEPARSATAVTTEPTELMVISREAFFSLMRRLPSLAVKILWNLTLRLSANLRRTSAALAALEQHAPALEAPEPPIAGPRPSAAGPGTPEPSAAEPNTAEPATPEPGTPERGPSAPGQPAPGPQAGEPQAPGSQAGEPQAGEPQAPGPDAPGQDS